MPEPWINGFFLGVAETQGACVVGALSIRVTTRPGVEYRACAEAVGDARNWRFGLYHHLGIRPDTILSGAPIVTGQFQPGEFGAWDDDAIDAAKACMLFPKVVEGITFGGKHSIMAVATTHNYAYPQDKTLSWISLRGMLQRMQMKCYREKRDGMLFLPPGRQDFIEAFEGARTKLNAGSGSGGWPRDNGGTRTVKNLPLTMFRGEAIVIDPADSTFLQAADLLAHAALLKRFAELGWLPGHLKGSDIGEAYDRLPAAVLNIAACRAGTQDAIVRNG